MIPTQAKDSLPVMATPNVIYKFTCTCSMQYIGLTERRIGDRVGEHIPNWLLKGIEKTPRSSIGDHISSTDHNCSRDQCFEVLYRARNRRILKFVEAVAIRLYTPKLNVMKDLRYNLRLSSS